MNILLRKFSCYLGSMGSRFLKQRQHVSSFKFKDFSRTVPMLVQYYTWLVQDHTELVQDHTWLIQDNTWLVQDFTGQANTVVTFYHQGLNLVWTSGAYSRVSNFYTVPHKTLPGLYIICTVLQYWTDLVHYYCTVQDCTWLNWTVQEQAGLGLDSTEPVRIWTGPHRIYTGSHRTCIGQSNTVLFFLYSPPQDFSRTVQNL